MTELGVLLEPAPVIGVTVEVPAPIVLVTGQPATLDVELVAQAEIALQVVPQPELAVVLESAQGPAGPPGAGLETLTAAVPLNAYKLVTTDAAGAAIYADAADADHADQVVGIAINSALSGSPVTVRAMGFIDNPGWSWTPGAPLFVGLDGDITSAQVGAFSQGVGYAATPTRMFIRLDRAILRG